MQGVERHRSAIWMHLRISRLQCGLRAAWKSKSWESDFTAAEGAAYQVAVWYGRQ